MTHLPKFSPALLHPRYWLLWLGIGLLWLVVQLPYPLIYRLGNAIGRLAMRFMKRRAKIAYRNLELCFPEKSEQERHRMVVMNFESVGMGLMETGMAWFWPVRRIARWTDTIGFEHIRDVQAQQRGILLIGIHFLTLEMGKGMIRALKKGEVVWYAPDHDYGPTASVFAPLFAVDQAATTSGTWMLAKMSKACIVPFVPRRKPDGKGYELIILPPECSPPLDDAETTAAWMNKIVEQCIMMAPEQYMWLHRRFKTRPEGMPSRY
ncbi:MAG: lipid A biosynthesis lauroyl acyltransferase [Klebsiella pneumoniae]|nr:lipid A biosynthesis lauroyl acyltransferase [Klebsiella pneumoniae]